MSDTVDEILTRRLPTTARPLLGLTLLLVEDSRYASEAMRLMCLRSGARLRRAGTLRAARRHLSAYRPSLMIVDLGLPDGSGLDMISDLHQLDADLAVVATSGDSGAEEAALAAGARAFLSKPVPSLGAFQTAVLACLPPDSRPLGPREISSEAVQPDAVALHDDLAHAAELLRGPADPDTCAYIAQFLGGVARSAGDTGLADRAEALRQDPAAVAGLAALLNDRMERAAIL